MVFNNAVNTPVQALINTVWIQACTVQPGATEATFMGEIQYAKKFPLPGIDKAIASLRKAEWKVELVTAGDEVILKFSM